MYVVEMWPALVLPNQAGASELITLLFIEPLSFALCLLFAACSDPNLYTHTSITTQHNIEVEVA